MGRNDLPDMYARHLLLTVAWDNNTKPYIGMCCMLSIPLNSRCKRKFLD